MSKENTEDLFEQYEKLPKKIQKLLDKWNERVQVKNEDPIKVAASMLKKFEKEGYIFDYGFDGSGYDLKKI